MSDPFLELQALKERVQADEEKMSELRDTNYALLEQLQSQPAPSPHQPQGIAPPAVGVVPLFLCPKTVIFVPKERKFKIFTGGSSAVFLFYEWVDDINAVLNYRPYEGTDKAVCIY